MKAFLFSIIAPLVLFGCLSCRNKNNVEVSELEKNDTICVSTKVGDIYIPGTFQILEQIEKNYVTEILFQDGQFPNFSKIQYLIMPYIVPSTDLLSIKLEMDFYEFGGIEGTSQTLAEFCDTKHTYRAAKNNLLYRNDMKADSVVYYIYNDGFYSYCVRFQYKKDTSNFESQIGKTNLVKVVRKDREFNKLDILKEYMRFFNENAPVRLANINIDEMAVSADLKQMDIICSHAKNVVNTINYDYLFDFMHFFIYRNPYLGLAMFYREEEQLIPMKILVKDVNGKLISSLNTAQLFDQFKYLQTIQTIHPIVQE